MRDAILILAGGASQIPFVLSLRSLGVALVIVDRDEYAACRCMSDYFICESTENPSAILEKIRDLARSLRFVAVWTQSSGRASVTQTILARELGVRHFSLRLAELAVDKAKLAQYLFENGFSVPRPLQVPHAGGDLSYPVVVRPAVTTVGKRMIFQVNDAGGLATALKQARRFSANGTAQLSEYIQGEDLILVGIHGESTAEPIAIIREHNLFRHGVVVNLGYELVREQGRYPTHAMVAEIGRLIDLSGGGFGVFLASFRVSKDRFGWIELHLDFGGDFLFDKLLSNGFGRDAVSAVARRLLWPSPTDCTPTGRASLLYTLVAGDAVRLSRLKALAKDPDLEITLERPWTRGSPMDRIGIVSVVKPTEVACGAVVRTIDVLLARSRKTIPAWSEESLVAA